MRSSRESGQASPLYVFMVASLLFLALAFFAVGQAGAVRNGAQTAADAAALAAARDSRDSLPLSSYLDVDSLTDLFGGELIGPDGCTAGNYYAEQNDAGMQSCVRHFDRWAYTVTVESQNPVGDTVLPGTESSHAIATATAVVEPRCTFEAPSDGEPPKPKSLDCDGDVLELDPADLPDLSDLFDVRLAED
ncbi:pilus assembly protein TadG-related protein [Streptomyces sp. HMX112]|uniref:pilus assembly protein TadG-related protein n=1 Tax=Streptomyces sp. HMX112 TaxID=3390850 RepID=UPI003A810A0E